MPNTLPSINSIKIKNSSPLIICDADEVIFKFMDSFEIYLKTLSLHFNWKSYALSKNIIKKDGTSVKNNEIKNLISSFFKDYTLQMKPVKGAVEGLNRLSSIYDIIILSNIPHEYYKTRIDALKNIDINFTFISNKGEKGKADKELTKNIKKKCWFIDDSPSQILSVNKEAPKVKTLHFLPNKKLLSLIKKHKYTFSTIENWKKLEQMIVSETDV